MCFAPQWCAFFQHLNFQKRSDSEVLCTFWLGHVLRARTACSFLTSQLPKVVRAHHFLTLLTPKCASRGNVQFFISHLDRWLRTRRFSEPTFLFAHLHLLSSDSFSSLIFFLLLFSSLLFSSPLLSSLLWLFPPPLFICPYCAKFDF